MDHAHPRIGLLIAGMLSCAWSPSTAIAGPLDPPPGPVAPSMKTLLDIEPGKPLNTDNTPGGPNSIYRITTPGSYYLTDNIAGVAAKHAIEIDSDNVTVNLGGFVLQGAPGSLDGIHATANTSNLRFYDGSITGWGDDGIDATDSDCVTIQNIVSKLNGATGLSTRTGAVVRDVTAASNGSHGLSFVDDYTVERVHATDNAGNGINGNDRGVISLIQSYRNENGISVGRLARITDAECNENAASGIVYSWDTTLERITANGNTLSGVSGGESLLAINITTSDNQGAGITAGQRAHIQNAVADNNAAAGIDVASQSTVTDSRVTRCGTFAVSALKVGDGSETGGLIARCTAIANRDIGIDAGFGVVVQDCVSDDNMGNGFRGSGSVFLRCVATDNTGNGFLPGGASRTEACTARGNSLEGFFIHGGSEVRECSAFSNSSNGFQIQGGASLIDCVARGQASGYGFNVEFATGATLSGCEAGQNQRGFRIGPASVQNVIVRCRSIANTITQYEISIPANNKVAPIVSDPAVAGVMDNLQ